MCEIDWDSDSGMRFWNDDRRTARKAYRCDACAGTIEPGQKYVRHSSMSGDCDAPTDEKLCAPCDALMVEFGSVEGHPPRTTPGSLDAYIGECIDNDDEQTYDEAKDEFVPGPKVVRWRAMLDEMKERRAARKNP